LESVSPNAVRPEIDALIPDIMNTLSDKIEIT